MTHCLRCRHRVEVPGDDRSSLSVDPRCSLRLLLPVALPHATPPHSVRLRGVLARPFFAIVSF